MRKNGRPWEHGPGEHVAPVCGRACKRLTASGNAQGKASSHAADLPAYAQGMLSGRWRDQTPIPSTGDIVLFFRSQPTTWQQPFTPPEVTRGPARRVAEGPRRRRGVHRDGLEEAVISSTDGGTFFVVVVAQDRSAQLRASVPPPKNFPAAFCAKRPAGLRRAPRGPKNRLGSLVQEKYGNDTQRAQVPRACVAGC